MASGGQVANYRRDQVRRGLRPGSIEKMEISLRSFSRWLDGDLYNATETDVQAFLDGRRISARTRYCWLSTLHGFYVWSIRNGLTEHDPTALIVRPKLRRTLPRPISDDDLAMALSLAEPMMLAWLSLASFAGLRCAEIAELCRDSIIEDQDLLRVMGKGARERLVPLHPAAWDALRAYGLPRRAGRVFVKPNGCNWSPAYLSRAAATFFTDIGVPATLHMCRHWFATKTYAACSDIRVVQELLGHASPSTTAIYVAFSPTVATAAVRALSVA